MVDLELSPVDIKLEGIGHVLRDRRLQVPPYQRGYSWDAEEVAEFWWDLRAAFGTKNPQYFLGTIVLTKSDKGGHGSIIDGQQRLTTTALLFLSLRNEFLRRADSDRAQVVERDYGMTLDLRSGTRVTRLTLNADDQPHFQQAMQSDASSDDRKRSGPDNGSTIVKALTFLEGRIREEAKNAGPHWPETLFRWIEFLEHQVRVITVTVASEADAFLIFETLNARGRELTIADLLKSFLFGLSGDSIAEMQNNWVSALRALETSANEEVFTTYLRHLWSSRNGATRERELYAKIKAVITSKPAALSFGKQIEESAPLYAALLSAEQPYWTGHEGLQNLAQTLLRLGLEQNRPLLLAAMDRFRPDELNLLIKSVISWSVRGLVVGGIGGGTMERAYAEAAVAVTEGRSMTTAAVFDDLADFIATDEIFRQAFAVRRISRTSLAKYLLVALLHSEQKVPDAYVVSDAVDSRYRLTTRLPRNADPQGWKEFPADELSQWTFRLGNMFIVGEQDNKVMGPAERAAGDWSPACITARQEELAALAVHVWPRRM